MSLVSFVSRNVKDRDSQCLEGIPTYKKCDWAEFTFEHHAGTSGKKRHLQWRLLSHVEYLARLSRIP